MKILDTILISILISIFVSYLSKPKIIEHQDGNIVDTKSIQNLGAIAGKILNKDRLEIGSNVDIIGDLNLSGNLNIVPAGVIVAFHKEKPPPGWALCDGEEVNGFKTPDLRFRFILGACDNSKKCKKYKDVIKEYNIDGNPKLKYEFGDTGGEFAHKLTVDELASHTHKYIDTAADADLSDYFDDDDWAGNKSFTRETEPAGKDMPHNNMPPYYILTYIIKLPFKRAAGYNAGTGAKYNSETGSYTSSTGAVYNGNSGNYTSGTGSNYRSNVGTTANGSEINNYGFESNELWG